MIWIKVTEKKNFFPNIGYIFKNLFLLPSSIQILEINFYAAKIWKQAS